MTFMNCFTQFNTNNFSGFNNFFSPQLPFMNFSWNNIPVFNFNWGWNNTSFNLSNFNIWDNIPTFNSWNNTNSNINWSSNFDIGDTFTRTTYTTNSVKNNNNSYKAINLDGYNSAAGNKLAKYALNHSVGFTQYCSRYVNNALENTGLSNGQRGNGYQMAGILRKNPNFKEISTNVDYKNLPAGCILVYNRGAQGYSSTYGHVEITTGDGRGVSDGITNNIRKPSAIFMPV